MVPLATEDFAQDFLEVIAPLSCRACGGEVVMDVAHPGQLIRRQIVVQDRKGEGVAMECTPVRPRHYCRVGIVTAFRV
jgi:hypothetical protein